MGVAHRPSTAVGHILPCPPCASAWLRTRPCPPPPPKTLYPEPTTPPHPPTPQIIFVENTADDPARRKPDITKARTLLGWEPKIPLREGLLLMIDDFRQ